MWNDVRNTLPQEEGDYLVCQTPDHKNFFIGVSWFKPNEGFSYGYFVYAWAVLPTMPQLTPRGADSFTESGTLPAVVNDQQGSEPA